MLYKALDAVGSLLVSFLHPPAYILYHKNILPPDLMEQSYCKYIFYSTFPFLFFFRGNIYSSISSILFHLNTAMSRNVKRIFSTKKMKRMRHLLQEGFSFCPLGVSPLFSLEGLLCFRLSDLSS